MLDPLEVRRQCVQGAGSAAQHKRRPALCNGFQNIGDIVLVSMLIRNKGGIGFVNCELGVLHGRTKGRLLGQDEMLEWGARGRIASLTLPCSALPQRT